MKECDGGGGGNSNKILFCAFVGVIIHFVFRKNTLKFKK